MKKGVSLCQLPIATAWMRPFRVQQRPDVPEEERRRDERAPPAARRDEQRRQHRVVPHARLLGNVVEREEDRAQENPHRPVHVLLQPFRETAVG